MIGSTIGRFRIVARIGSGGMGTVWRAEDPHLARTVAIKLLAPALTESDTARRRFLVEARAAGELEHPNVVRVYDAGEDGGVAWIAYQYIDGESLAHWPRPVPLPLARSVATDIGEALAHAHAHGIVHRDVKPGNVMVRHDGKAVLVDFGLARPEHGLGLTVTGEVLGTAGYLAPEVLSGRPADARSDLYSLGATIHEMLTGRPPFDGQFAKALSEPVPPPSQLRQEIPPAFERVVLRLLERDPANRYDSAEAAVAALRELQLDRPPSPMERMKRAWDVRRRRIGAGLLRLGHVRVGLTSLAAVASIVAVAWFATARGWVPAFAPKAPVLAVLPFQNASLAPEESDYLKEGFGDGLVLKFSGVKECRVLPCTTTRRQADSTSSPPQLARGLGASLLLVGTFRFEDGRLHVTAALIDGKSGVQVWAEAFDGLASDVMSVQARIAIGVLDALSGGIPTSERTALAQPPSRNAEAYEMYLRGADYLWAPDVETRLLARPFLNRAIELDPQLAVAYVGRGAAVMDEHFRGTRGGIADLQGAQRDFLKALEIDPGLLRARRALVQLDLELGHTEEVLRTASPATRKGDSDVEGLLVRGLGCMLGGLKSFAPPLFARALELDPSNQEAAWYHVVALEWADRHEEAFSAGSEYVQRYGEDSEIEFWMAVASASLGRRAVADTLFERALALMGDLDSDLYGPLMVSSYYLRNGREARGLELSRKWIVPLQRMATAAPDNYRVAGVLAGMLGVSGESVAMRDSLFGMVRRIRANPDFSVGGLMLVVPGVLESGTGADVDTLVACARTRDLGTLQDMTMHWYDLTIGTSGSHASPEMIARVKELQSEVAARLDLLTTRFGPSLVLKTP